MPGLAVTPRPPRPARPALPQRQQHCNFENMEAAAVALIHAATVEAGQPAVLRRCPHLPPVGATQVGVHLLLPCGTHGTLCSCWAGWAGQPCLTQR